MKTSIPSFSINRERLARILRSEFELWVNNFGTRPMPEAQELRGFFVQWFAVFAPECFEPSLVGDIRSFAYETRQHPDFNLDKWYEVLPIENSLYALRSDPYWVRTSRWNLSHHNSSLRSFVLEASLLVVHKIRFDEAEWLARVTDNLKGRHFGAMDSVLFLCMAQGDAKTKKKQIRRWRDQADINTSDREELDTLLRNCFARNPFFYETTRNAFYISLRLASRETPHVRQLELPIISAEMIWRRMNDHPVFQPYIHIPDEE